jgi:hypothetical protein
MIIFLGGFPGSGRRKFARELCRRYGVHRHHLSQYMLRRYSFDVEGRCIERVIVPASDSERLRVYKRATADFSMLSKLHKHVLIEDGFLRKEPREYLFREARTYFDAVAVVWIDADDTQALRIADDLRERGFAQPAARMLRRRARAQSLFEPFTDPVATFRTDESEEDSIARLWQFIAADAAHNQPVDIPTSPAPSLHFPRTLL